MLDRGEVPQSLDLTAGDAMGYSAVNGELHEASNGPSDAQAVISTADRLQAEPESLRKWREEQRETGGTRCQLVPAGGLLVYRDTRELQTATPTFRQRPTIGSIRTVVVQANALQPI